MGIFDLIFGSNKNSQKGKQKNKKIEKDKTKVDNPDKFRLTTEEIVKIKDFETQWSIKVNESTHIKIPSLGKGKNGIVEDLIELRGIRNLKSNDKGLYDIKENSQKQKMLEIENSLINIFLIDTQYFISGNKKLVFLTSEEETLHLFFIK